MNVRRARHARLPAPFLWTIAGVATIATCALYTVQLAAAIVLHNELRQTCRSHPPLEIAQYFWITLLLAAIGVVAAATTIVSTSRRSAHTMATILLLISGLVLLLSWYGFTTRGDWIGPLCSNL